MGLWFERSVQTASWASGQAAEAERACGRDGLQEDDSSSHRQQGVTRITVRPSPKLPLPFALYRREARWPRVPLLEAGCRLHSVMSSSAKAARGLCHLFQKDGACRYGDKCKFSHGDEESAAGAEAAPAAPHSAAVTDTAPRGGGKPQGERMAKEKKGSLDRATLIFVSGLEQCIRGSKPKRDIQALFQPFGRAVGRRTTSNVERDLTCCTMPHILCVARSPCNTETEQPDILMDASV